MSKEINVKVVHEQPIEYQRLEYLAQQKLKIVSDIRNAIEERKRWAIMLMDEVSDHYARMAEIKE